MPVPGPNGAEIRADAGFELGFGFSFDADFCQINQV
jgi:hypothetical protein